MALDELHCLNCKKSVSQDQGQLFAQVFVCPECYAMAEHFFERLEKELRSLQLVAKEAIRTALAEGRFSFPENPGSTEISKREVLEGILQLQEAKEKCQTAPTGRPKQSTTSTEITPPFARALDALENAHSNTPTPRG